LGVFFQRENLMLEVEIPLTKGYVATVDVEALSLIGHVSWCASEAHRKVYALGWMDGKKVLMHRVILNPPHPLVTDHKDHDGLNNTGANLRACTRSENQRNRRPSHTGTSEYLGVSWCKSHNMWRAQITVNGRTLKIGRFHNEIYAAGAYDREALAHHGEFARLNFSD
jgi:hypothetical protein